MANSLDSRTPGTERFVWRGAAVSAARAVESRRVERELASSPAAPGSLHAPRRFYHDPAVYALELQAMFLQDVLCVGREEDIACSSSA